MRGLIVNAVVLVAMLLLAWLGYRALFGGGARLVVVESTGTVAGTSGSAERDAVVGDGLGVLDRVVSGSDGRAVLALQDAGGRASARLTLGPSTAVQVEGVGGDGVRVSLEGGRVQATVRPGAGSVGVVADGREVVAEDADFTVARDESGTFGAELLRGEVEVRGVPGVSRVAEGARVVAAVDADPVVGPADDALLLFVEPLPVTRTRAGSATVSGRSQPGATVRVGRGDAWVTTRADASGAFRVEVPLVEGDNPLRVEARDVFGNIGVGDLRVTRDTLAPSVGVEVRY